MHRASVNQLLLEQRIILYTLPSLSGSFPPVLAHRYQKRKRKRRRSLHGAQKDHAVATLARVLAQYLDKMGTHKSDLASNHDLLIFLTIPTRSVPAHKN
jgi:hypothetical protein